MDKDNIIEFKHVKDEPKMSLGEFVEMARNTTTEDISSAIDQCERNGLFELKSQGVSYKRPTISNDKGKHKGRER